ncbi:MAG: hypothetical protein ACTHJ0_10540 [Flavipsychrobacter sp.]
MKFTSIILMLLCTTTGYSINKNIKFRKYLLFIICIACMNYHATAQSRQIPDTLLGEYIAYRYVDLPVVALSYQDAKLLLGKKMVIQRNRIIVFNDTLTDVSYTITKSDQIDFFRAYRHFDWRRLGIKEDSIDVLSANNTFHAPVDVVLAKEDFFVTEYKGFYFLFHKKKYTHGRSSLKKMHQLN